MNIDIDIDFELSVEVKHSKIRKMSNKRCSEGIKLPKNLKKSEEMSEINSDRLNLMLELLVNRLLDDDEFREFTGLFKDGIFQRMTLDVVKSKVMLKKYKSTNEFMDDIRMISTGQLFSEDFNVNRNQSLDNLKEFCKQEVYDINSCDFCYANAIKYSDWFSLVCPRRHPLAWAKVMGHPYAPAKVMKYNPIKKSFVVYFFGDHETAIIPSHYCLGFTEKSPNKIVTLQQRKDINAAMKEVLTYIDNLKKSGSFKYVTLREKFDQHSLSPRPQKNVTSTTSSVNVPEATNCVELPMIHLPSASSPNGATSTSVVDMDNDTNCVSVPIIITPTTSRFEFSSNTNTIPNTRSRYVSSKTNTISPTPSRPVSSNTSVIPTKVETSSLIEVTAEDPDAVNNDALVLLNKILEGKDNRLETMKKELTAIQELEQMKDVHLHKLKDQLLTEKNKHFKEMRRLREESDNKIQEIKRKIYCAHCQNELNTLTFCNPNCSLNWTTKQK